ncbi:hypothetical protein EVAR_51227_1 [Eumeta japonica]|uniref:Uncharacterized protein n=1 Tax=Eumeta variegata TaxID=151549 RepID=A0A4C1ZBB0_EUMVA|nr:hypothetical protein EVAR_51227_1 [Eumeta japonica]
MQRSYRVEIDSPCLPFWGIGLSSVARVYGGSRILFFHPRKSGCPISGYEDGGLEVHSVSLLRQPQPATFLLIYMPALPTAECIAPLLPVSLVPDAFVAAISDAVPEARENSAAHVAHLGCTLCFNHWRPGKFRKHIRLLSPHLNLRAPLQSVIVGTLVMRN